MGLLTVTVPNCVPSDPDGVLSPLTMLTALPCRVILDTELTVVVTVCTVVSVPDIMEISMDEVTVALAIARISTEVVTKVPLPSTGKVIEGP